MQSVFNSGLLERIAAADSLIAFDFDGTLAPIVADPAQAAMRGTTRRLLAEAARLYPCAVVSGRAEEDVLRLLDGVTVWYVIGNRALQPLDAIERFTAQVGAWRPMLGVLDRLSGITIEDKGVSLAIHYRNALDHDRARAAIVAAARRLERARAIEGKEVVNLIPEDAADKGAALDRVRKQLGCAQTLYAGDDRTDEAAFALDGVAGVRVGESDASAARHCLRDQSEIDDLLDRLVALRPRRVLRPEEMWRTAPRRYPE
ncbi:MAG: trehalose-phosphatase [Myxococcales bacterium]|nr:trehalose-phosphatase [Myxococcales bacterium]